MFNPKQSHELALKRLVCYLKHTNYCGLVLNPNYDVCKVDIYPYTNFAGMYGHYKPTYPECVKSCTRFILMFEDCPVLWLSKLQTDTDISTLETEIKAMAHFCRVFFKLLTLQLHLVRQLFCLWVI